VVRRFVKTKGAGSTLRVVGLPTGLTINAQRVPGLLNKLW